MSVFEQSHLMAKLTNMHTLIFVHIPTFDSITNLRDVNVHNRRVQTNKTEDVQDQFESFYFNHGRLMFAYMCLMVKYNMCAPSNT